MSIDNSTIRAAAGDSQRFGTCVLRAFLARLDMAWRVRGERRELVGLDDALLKDIGVTPGEVAEEVRRSFWDIDERG